ncbi:RES domain-containing protein [Actinomyces ruminicola]|uniref:RES domain-containing protein n=1 Tax=Actinomyces ruminicola TaxID=332524 RepID=UPI0034E8A8EF
MLCEPTGPLYRIGRAEAPFHFSEITPEVSGLPNAGNRFDVLGGGVMYAASTPTGAFVETLQSFRPTTSACTAYPGGTEPVHRCGEFRRLAGI